MVKGKGRLRRYLLILEYDGTNFSGWQKQTGVRTVQGDVLKAAVRIFGDVPMDIQGCGRTDAGVHALNYAAHLEVESNLSELVVIDLLNENLAKDIAVRRVEMVDSSFHARHSCVGRSYIYQIRTRKSAFGKRYSWWIREDLDPGLMEEACGVMTGMHDFSALADKKELKKSTRVLVYSLDLLADENGFTVRVVGSHFLWHMVRRMAAILVEVGCRRLTVEEVSQLLIHPHGGQHFNQTAPAAGLFFERAFYDDDELQGFCAE